MRKLLRFILWYSWLTLGNRYVTVDWEGTQSWRGLHNGIMRLARSERQNNEMPIRNVHFILICWTILFIYTLHRDYSVTILNFETTQFRFVYYIIISTIESSLYCYLRNILHHSHCSLSTNTRIRLIPFSYYESTLPVQSHRESIPRYPVPSSVYRRVNPKIDLPLFSTRVRRYLR